MFQINRQEQTCLLFGSQKYRVMEIGRFALGHLSDLYELQHRSNNMLFLPSGQP